MTTTTAAEQTPWRPPVAGYDPAAAKAALRRLVRLDPYHQPTAEPPLPDGPEPVDTLYLLAERLDLLDGLATLAPADRRLLVAVAMGYHSKEALEVVHEGTRYTAREANARYGRALDRLCAAMNGGYPWVDGATGLANLLAAIERGA